MPANLSSESLLKVEAGNKKNRVFVTRNTARGPNVKKMPAVTELACPKLVEGSK